MPTGNGGPAERFDIGEGTSLGEIARYRCIRNEKLGSGHFANVYAVENISTHQKFALKLLPEEEINGEETAALKTANKPDASGTCPRRFIRHVDSFLVELPVRTAVGSTIDGETIVETRTCLVTEPLCQWTLEDKLEDKYQTYTLHSAVKYLLQLSEAAVDLEARRLRHGDLNPRNVYITYEDDVRVGDFGISGRQKAHGGDRNSEGIIVNDHSKPPEASKEGAVPDNRWDLWALGVLAYRLLTRHNPVEADFFLPKPSSTSSASASASASSSSPLHVAPVPPNPVAPRDYAGLIKERRLFGETPVPDKLLRLVQTLLSEDPDAREDANYACSTLRRIYNELPVDEKLVRAREAYEVNNFYEAKDLCFSILDEWDSVPELSRAEALVLKGLSLLAEDGYRCVPKAKKALGDCRAILEQLIATMKRLDTGSTETLREPGRLQELEEEGWRCLKRAEQELGVCTRQLERLGPGHALTAQRGSECLNRTTAALRDHRHYRKMCELWGLWKLGHGWVSEEEIRYVDACEAYGQALAMFEELRDWRRYVPAVLRLAKLQRTLVMLPQARRVLEAGRDRVERDLQQWALCKCDNCADTSENVDVSSAPGSAHPTSLPGSTGPVPPLARTNSSNGSQSGGTTCRHREVLEHRLTSIRIELAALDHQEAKYKNATHEYEETKVLCCRARMCTQLELASIYKGLGSLYVSGMSPQQPKEEAKRKGMRMYHKALLLLTLKGTVPKEEIALLNNVCSLHRENKELKEARDCLTKANEIEISNLRDDHPLRARTLMSWGNIYLGENAWDQALKHYEQALAVSRNAFCGDGRTHPEVAGVISNIGLYHQRKLEDYPTAIKNFQEALAIYLNCYQETHFLVAQCKANLVTALEKNGEEEEALKHFCTGFVEHVKPEHVSNLYSKFRALVEKMGPDSLSGILANYRARAKEHAADTDERKVLELRIQRIEEAITALRGGLPASSGPSTMTSSNYLTKPQAPERADPRRDKVTQDRQLATDPMEVDGPQTDGPAMPQEGGGGGSTNSEGRRSGRTKKPRNV